MKTFDVGLGWAHPADESFRNELKTVLRKRKLSFREITFASFYDDYHEVEKGQLGFKLFIDRSADDYSAYLLLCDRLKARGTHIINDPSSIIEASSKVQMHKVCLEEDLALPKTFILHPQRCDKKKVADIVSALGAPFVLKPSYGGGGENVLVNARSAEDIFDYLEENTADECLAQEYVTTEIIAGKQAWFRTIFVCGKIIPHWWDPKTGFYISFGMSQEEQNIARVLSVYTNKIHSRTGLDFFSTEIAVRHRENSKSGVREYLIIDYANFPIDLSVQGIARDGIPEKTLNTIIEKIVSFAGTIKKKNPDR